MIIFAKIRISIDYKVFILLNVHPAKNRKGTLREVYVAVFLSTRPPKPAVGPIALPCWLEIGLLLRPLVNTAANRSFSKKSLYLYLTKLDAMG